MKKALITIFIFSAAIFFAGILFHGCGKDSNNNPVTPPTSNEDFFPFKANYLWRYTTTVFDNRGFPDATMELKLDTITTPAGKYWWLLARLPDVSPTWTQVVALLDSGNVVYSLGDNPPGTPMPMFLHKYAQGEGVRDTVTVQGKVYQAIRIDNIDANNVKLSHWFVDGVGMIKEYSSQGATIFFDDNWGSEIEMRTELVSYTK